MVNELSKALSVAEMKVQYDVQCRKSVGTEGSIGVDTEKYCRRISRAVVGRN